ncbi:hypothetical protein F7D57_01805 [Prevotella copri]|uniref:Uncharacterized protein n=1 Tax=Segatella copri TaxID=165179 RepID=A0AA91A3D8_9BACT|nr:hypothetical protein [Segatella copri]MQO08479.1 hypothetical protein [Segatella copri]
MARQEKSLAVCLEILQDYTAKDISLFAVLTTADFYSHNSQFHFYRTIFICRSDFLSSTRSFLLASTVIVQVQRYGSGLWK